MVSFRNFSKWTERKQKLFACKRTEIKEKEKQMHGSIMVRIISQLKP